jgi:hypothetical protein
MPRAQWVQASTLLVVVYRIRACSPSVLHLGREHQGYLVLDRENVVDGAIVPFGPEMRAVRRVDQLRRDPDPGPAPTYAALENITHAKLLRRLADVDRTSFVDEAPIAGDDPKPVELRQSGDDVFNEAIAEILLLGVAAHVLKGQYGN